VIALLAIAAAHAQDAAPVVETAGGTLGDYTGPVGLIVGVVYALDKAGLLKVGRKGDNGENAAVAALDARLKSAETTITRLGERVDHAETDRARHDERIAGLRSDLDAHRQQCATDRAADRAETAGRLDRLANAIDSRR